MAGLFRAAYLPYLASARRAVLATNLPIDRGAPLVGNGPCDVSREPQVAFQPFAEPALRALPGYRDLTSHVGFLYNELQLSRCSIQQQK